MDPIKVTFVIGQLMDGDMLALKNNETIVSKMILIPDDYKLFHYIKKKTRSRLKHKTATGSGAK